jgi:hypothetical protein
LKSKDSALKPEEKEEDKKGASGKGTRLRANRKERE